MLATNALTYRLRGKALIDDLTMQFEGEKSMGSLDPMAAAKRHF